MYTSFYMENFPLSVRKAETRRLAETYPNLVPVIVEKAPRVALNQIRIRYLLPRNFFLYKLYAYLRWALKLEDKALLVLSTNDYVPDVLHKLGDLHDDHSHEDGFLYMVYHDGSVDANSIRLVDKPSSLGKVPKEGKEKSNTPKGGKVQA